MMGATDRVKGVKKKNVKKKIFKKGSIRIII